MNEATVERMVKGGAAVVGSMVAALVALLLLLAASGSAHATTAFTVTLTSDLADANLDDSLCDADLRTRGSQCTLRAAIQEANNTPGADTINFNIPGTGVKTIAPASELPRITEAVTIDGYTQPGASRNTLTRGATNAALMIELNGERTGFGGTGVEIRSSNTVVRGLVINRFGRGIGIIRTIGGPQPAGNKIEGNFIGTDVLGSADRGNAHDGVFISEGINNTIGGTAPASRNLISGNASDGVKIQSQSTGTKVEGNLIGTDKTGTADLGNDWSGVFIYQASGNTVGGASPDAANTIAFNGDQGVGVSIESSNNRIASNSIFSNDELGIDLAGGNENASGVTANDGDDPATRQPDPDKDTGPNDLQNYPVISSATASGTSITVGGTLNSTPGKTFLLQFFSNPSGDEGKRLLGQKSVTTDLRGNAAFTVGFATVMKAGQTVTATATGPGGSTSEFSAPRTVVAQ